MSTDANDPPPAYSPFPTTPLPSSSNPQSEAPHTSRARFGWITLSKKDLIGFINIPSSDISHVQTHITESWRKGIQDTRHHGTSYEMKLRGTPLASSTTFSHHSEEIQLMVAVLRGMWERGWMLKPSVDVSFVNNFRESMLFRHQDPPPPPHTWISVSWYSGNMMHLTDAPPELCEELGRALGERIKRQRDLGNGVYEVKFEGYLWPLKAEQTVEKRLVLATLLEVLEAHGFSFYTSIAWGVDKDAPSDECDAWVCFRREGWKVGEPIYHS